MNEVQILTIFAVICSIGLVSASAEEGYIIIPMEAGQTTSPFCIKNSAGTELVCFDTSGNLDMNTLQLKGSSGCANGDIREYNSATDIWECGDDDTGAGSADTITEGDTNVETIDAGTGQIDFDVDGSLFARITSAIFDFNENIAQDISYFINGTNNLFFPQGGSQTLLGDLLLTDDFTIINNDGTYIAFDGDASVVSSNSDLDTVWTAVKAHTDYVNKDAIKIQFGTGEFHSDVGLDVQRSNVTIAGNGMGVTWFYQDIGTPESTPMWAIGGTTVDDRDDFAPDASAGDVSVTLVTTANATSARYPEGSWVTVNSDFLFGLASYQTRGELKRINATDSGTGVVTFYSTLYEDYDTVGGVLPSINPIPNMLTNINLKDFSVTDLRPEGSLTTNTRTIQNQFVENLTIDSVEIENGAYIALGLDAVVHGKVSNCYIRDTNLVAGLSYAIAVRGLSNSISITGCNFENNRYALTVNSGSATFNGETRNILFDGNTILDPNYACTDTHEGVEGLVVSNNVCIGRSEQQTLVSADATLTDCWKMRGSGVITGNMCKNVDNNGVNHFTQTNCVNAGDNCNVHSSEKLIVDGNHFENIGNVGIAMENTTHAIVSNNVLLDVAGDGIFSITSGATHDGGKRYYAMIANNVLHNIGSEAIRTDHLVDVIGNDIKDASGGSSSGAIMLTSTTVCGAGNYHICGVSGSRIIDNKINGVTTAGGIRVNQGNEITIDGNIIINTEGIAIRGSNTALYDLSNSTITNNRIKSAGYPAGGAVGLYLEDIIGTYIANNYFQNLTNANCAMRMLVSAEDNIVSNNVFSGVTCKINAVAGNNTFVNNLRLGD